MGLYELFILLFAAIIIIMYLALRNASPEKKKKVGIIFGILIFIGIVFVFISSNVIKTNGKAKIELRKSGEDLDKISFWGPYNYYEIEWRISPQNNKSYDVSMSGMSRFNLFGNINLYNNSLSSSILNLDSVNKTLEVMEINKPYLIAKNKFDTISAMPSKMYIMITNKPELYQNKEELIKLSY
jgi:hypothetical protein